jgi:peptidoglycan/LPS O-acetylase OafA/YrhL
MVVSLVVATALWLLPVRLAFLGPNRSGWQATAMALLLPGSLLALLVAFLAIETGAVAGGALVATAVTLAGLVVRGGKPG